MLITFEGLDFSGKTTQANLLVNRLKEVDKPVVFIREPGGTSISEKIRGILLDKQYARMNQITELFLFSASRAQLVSEVIRPALQAGKVVICDRFYDSTTAYQGHGRGLHLQGIETINKIATFGTTPTLTVLVEIEISEILRRQKAAGVSSDRMEALGKDFFAKVRDGYRRIAETEPKRFLVVNGMYTVEEIHNEIWTAVQQRLA